MTTLIIHPDIAVQRNSAFSLVNRYFTGEPGSIEESTMSPAIGMPAEELSDVIIPKLIIHPDLHIIDGALKNSIGIDTVRELIHEMQFRPYQAPVQVGLILLANMLTEEAQNSLLKTLEEPPEGTRYILTAPHEKFLLPTIRSRAQTYYIKERISAELPRATQPQAEEGEEPEARGSDIPIDDFVNKELIDKLLYLETLVNDDKDFPGAIAQFLAELTGHYRERLLEATRSKDADHAGIHSSELRRIGRAMHYINRNANKRLTLENLILHLEQSIMLRRPSDGKM